MRNERGFTLIELAIVMAIIGVLATIAIAQYTKHTNEARNVLALTELRIAMDAEEAYYVDNGAYTRDNAALEPYGLRHNPNVLVYLDYVEENNQRYTIMAIHHHGTKRYVVEGPGGLIDGQPK